MPVTTHASDDILSLLSPERRQEILSEVLGTELRNLVAAHQGSTFGALVEALTGHAHWSFLREISASVLFGGSPAAPVKAAPAAAPKASAPAAAPKAKEKAKAKPKAKAKAAKAKAPAAAKSGADTDALLAFIVKNPGSRAEVIRKELGGDAEAVTAGLAKLYAAGKVKRAGKARGTSYTAAAE